MRVITRTALSRVFFVVWLSGLTLLLACFAHAQDTDKAGKTERKDGDVTILVTVRPHDDRTRLIADRLQGSDFAVLENKKAREVISARRADTEPLRIAVLLQDDLVPRVNNELDGIREFIKGLPDGSQVLTGYITAGTLQVRQDFTANREKAADSLRIILGSAAGTPYNPYAEVIEAARKFDKAGPGRKLILLVSDGLDLSGGFRSASPSLSIDLDRAINECQRRGISVFTFYSPAVGLTSFSRIAVMYGQGSLNKLADDTGGEAFFTGTDFVTFDPYFRELDTELGQQWLITYRSEPGGKEYRRIEVTTDFDIHLHYPSGVRTN